MRKMNQKGFTIIELLVVIVIIGILVALTLPNLFSAQARGRDTDRKNELKNVQQKLETYFNDNGSYPAEGALADADVSSDEMQGPRNDAYTYESDGDSYTLTATLENASDPDTVDGSGADATYQLQSVNQ